MHKLTSLKQSFITIFVRLFIPYDFCKFCFDLSLYLYYLVLSFFLFYYFKNNSVKSAELQNMNSVCVDQVYEQFVLCMKSVVVWNDIINFKSMCWPYV